MRTLVSVETMPAKGYINVCWRDEENGEAETHRRAYVADQKDQFVSDIESADNGGSPGISAPYLTEMGW